MKTPKLHAAMKPHIPDESLVAGGSVGMKTGMKSCTRCRAAEWPCFLADALCRMCQALRRDEKRTTQERVR